MIPWLLDPPHFPPLSAAMREPNGLLAAGGDLTPEWLIEAYRHGIFPWYNAGEPILWWSPDPRMVLYPAKVRISRSLRRRLRGNEYEVRCDSAFAEVVQACAAPRRPGGGTWITEEMRLAYLAMHELGYAHSVECWQEGELVGGLYGMAFGAAFFGESMFCRATDASKIALAHLARHLDRKGFAVIDCQMETAHLASLGAERIPRTDFVAMLNAIIPRGPAPGRWPHDAMADIPWT
ncbi:MAG: leucyl/phenylalanyl-tRNA--protein transferase [Zoogloeaceae bacterium]|nr:leucyl/phenylalanyl-tRNA--protein transferase [Zoogloeaceae bacterium]